MYDEEILRDADSCRNCEHLLTQTDGYNVYAYCSIYDLYLGHLEDAVYTICDDYLSQDKGVC